MKETISNLFDSLKEKLKAVLQEQQESEWFIRVKEKYEELTPTMQKIVRYAGMALVVTIVLWIPVTNLMDASDVNSQFEQRRLALKELLKIERDYSSVPAMPNPPAPFSLKPQLDQKIIGQGLKPEQIKDVQEVSGKDTKTVEQKGISYNLTHVTVRQAIDIAYELEQTDKSFKLSEFQLDAQQEDPHFYDLRLKIINYSIKAPPVSAAPLEKSKARADAK